MSAPEFSFEFGPTKAAVPGSHPDDLGLVQDAPGVNPKF